MQKLPIVKLSAHAPQQQGDSRTVKGGMSVLRGTLCTKLGHSVLHLSPEAIKGLGLEMGREVALWRDGNGYRLGPYIGIMTVRRPQAQPGFAGIGGRRDNFVGLSRMGQKMGAVVFVFAAEDVDYQAQRITGFCLEGSGQWTRVSLPWPDVIYNRVPDRQSEEKAAVALLKKRFVAAGGALFNSGFFHKWQITEALIRQGAVKHYLPETKLLETARDFLSMLAEHSLLYLKPVSSFAGQGILQVSRLPHRLLLRYRAGDEVKEEHYGNVESLLRAVKQHKIPGQYLVQQGLALAKYRGAIFDARALVQKTSEGDWDLTGVGIRVASRGGITTHVPCGGHIASLENVLQEVYGETEVKSSGVWLRVKNLALAIAPAIEKSLGQTLGEMSMDIGITSAGHCYFLEANAKPMKFDEPHIWRRSLRRRVEYCRFLAGWRGDEVHSYAGN